MHAYVQAPQMQQVQEAAPGGHHFLTPHPLVHISVKGNSIFPVTQSPDPCLLSHSTSKNKSSQECLQKIFTESDHPHPDYCHQRPSGIPPASSAPLQDAAVKKTSSQHKSGRVPPLSKSSQDHTRRSQILEMDNKATFFSSQPPLLPHFISYNFPLLSAPGTLGFSNLLSKLYLGPPMRLDSPPA